MDLQIITRNKINSISCTVRNQNYQTGELKLSHIFSKLNGVFFDPVRQWERTEWTLSTASSVRQRVECRLRVLTDPCCWRLSWGRWSPSWHGTACGTCIHSPDTCSPACRTSAQETSGTLHTVLSWRVDGRGIGKTFTQACECVYLPSHSFPDVCHDHIILQPFR